MESLTWISKNGEVGIEVIKEIENELKIKLPKDYIECALLNNGGHPENRNIYDMEGREGAVFERLLSLHKEKSSYITGIYYAIEDRLIEGVYPFAKDPFGNFICFDYRKSKEAPEIVFWDHETAYENPDEAITRICSTFTELLEMLYEDIEDEDEE